MENKRKNKMNEITNKIKALIESEQEELKDIEEFKNKTKTKLDSDESFSLSTYRMLVRTLAEAALKIDLHKAFIKKLQNLLPKEFSKKLRNLRNEKGVTQQELAEALDVNRMTIVQWEKGASKPNYVILGKLADFFSVDVKYFYEENCDGDYFNNMDNALPHGFDEIYEED